MTDIILCPTCGKELAKTRLDRDFGGLCPHCLGAMMAQEETAGRGTATLSRFDIEKSPLQAGQKFANFDILEIVGRGGMGYVYRARRSDLNRIVALKILSPELAASDTFRARFDREARVLASVSHPNIVQVFGFGREGDLLYLEMEHVEGTDLDTLFRAKGKLDRIPLLMIVRDVARALGVIHEAGLVHRDIKPANILISGAGQAKIADFGIAIETEDNQRLTETGTFVGTPHYVSPEHVQGKRVDGRSDLYSLGIILYQGLAGKPPFSAPTPAALLLKHVNEAPPAMWKSATDVPQQLGELVRRLLAKNPSARYDSAKLLEVDLERALQEAIQRKSMEAPVTQATVSGRRKSTVRKAAEAESGFRIPAPRIMAVVGGAAALLLAVFLILAFRGGNRETPPPIVRKPELIRTAEPLRALIVEPEPGEKPKEAPSAPGVVDLPIPTIPAPPSEKPPSQALPQVQDLGHVLDKADKLVEEAKSSYETAKEKSSVELFTESAFKLEEARSKYQAVVEVGSEEKQKIAAEKLKVVNQLAKLVHDGKVAVSGNKPTDPPPVKAPPTDLPAPAFLPDPAPSAPAAVPLAKSKRSAIPDAARQKESEKALKDLFKAEYARRTSADKAALARILLGSAATQTDPGDRWAALTQAQELATQAGEWDVAWEAVGQTARFFDCDGAVLKLAVLAPAARAAKTPEDAGRLVERYLQVLDDAVSQEQMDAAEKSAQGALQMARRAANPALVAQATSRAKDVADLKSGVEKVRKARETLTKNPNDPVANQELGLFLCLVKGQWEAGLPFVAKGPEGPYKMLSIRELDAPQSAPEQSAIADSWWDAAEKESAALKSGARARSLYWYGRALERLEGIARTRVEKRLQDAEMAQYGYIDLLRIIDPGRDSVATTWKFENGVLVNGMNWRARLVVPYQPPDEYDLALSFTTTAEGNPVMIGLVSGTSQFHVSVDAWGNTFLDMVDRKGLKVVENTRLLNYGKGETTYGRENLVVCQVRRKGMTMMVNGIKAFSWEGASSRLSPNPEWAVPLPQALYLGSWDRPLLIRRLTLTPVSGQGRRLR